MAVLGTSSAIFPAFHVTWFMRLLPRLHVYKAVKFINNQFCPSVCLSVYQHIYQLKWLLYGAVTWHSKAHVHLKETKVYTEDWAKSTGWAIFHEVGALSQDYGIHIYASDK